MNRQYGRPAGQPGTGSGRLVWRFLAAAATLAAATPAPSATPGGIGTGTFGLSTAPDSQGRAAPYFNLTVAAGHSTLATVLVSNLGSKTEKLKIGRSIGITATNGGSAYSLAPGRCSGPGC